MIGRSILAKVLKIDDSDAKITFYEHAGTPRSKNSQKRRIKLGLTR